MEKIARISIKKEFEIRIKYEYGENLKDLAIKYKIPLSTLKKRKQKSERKGDPWIKGFRSKVKYEDFLEDAEMSKKEISDLISQKASNQLDHLEEIIYTQTADEKRSLKDPEDSVSLNKDKEAAVVKRVEGIKGILDLRRDINNIYTDKDQALIDKVKIETKLKGIELKHKTLDYELEEKISSRYLKKK